jgi:hypothetical protein
MSGRAAPLPIIPVPWGRLRGRALPLVVLLSCLLAAACQAIPFLGKDAALPTNGRIAWPKEGEVWTFNLADRQQKRIVEVPRGGAVTGIMWSPHGAHLAIYGISALYTVEAKGGQPWKLLEQGGYGGLDWTW